MHFKTIKRDKALPMIEQAKDKKEQKSILCDLLECKSSELEVLIKELKAERKTKSAEYELCEKTSKETPVADDKALIKKVAQDDELAEVISKRSAELKYVYQILMLVDEDSEPDVDKRVFRAFNFSENTAEEKAMIAENMKIYNAYFLGGLEVLHEQFVDECIDDDAYLNKIHEVVSHFYQEQDGDALKAGIDKILNG